MVFKADSEIALYCILNILLISLPTGKHLGGSVVEHLPLAQVMIPESWDQVLNQNLHREPASPSTYISASLMNK